MDCVRESEAILLWASLVEPQGMLELADIDEAPTRAVCTT